MAENRLDLRADCDETCVLCLGDLGHIAMVKNFSLGGALVYLFPPPPVLRVGDSCKISMNGGFLREYNCEVVRVETPHIALMFTDVYKFKASAQYAPNT